MKISKQYIDFIKKRNDKNKASSKEFFIVIQYLFENKEIEKQIQETIMMNFFNESFFKIKESLSRCGNIIYEISTKEEVEVVLKSFINPQMF